MFFNFLEFFIIFLILYYTVSYLDTVLHL